MPESMPVSHHDVARYGHSRQAINISLFTYKHREFLESILKSLSAPCLLFIVGLQPNIGVSWQPTGAARFDRSK